MFVRIEIESATWSNGDLPRDHTGKTPTIPPFNPIVSFGQKRRVKIFFKPFQGLLRVPVSHKMAIPRFLEDGA